MSHLQQSLFNESFILKTQEKTMFDRNMLIAKENELVHNLKATKARSHFI